MSPLAQVRGVSHCHGYSNGCVCGSCVLRAQGVASGRLFYAETGELRFRDNPALSNNDALRAYRLERVREARVEGPRAA